MIKVKCQVWLDDYKREEWPEYFDCRPEKGDRVCSKSGRELMINSITHACDTPYRIDIGIQHIPYIIIGLCLEYSFDSTGPK